MDTSSPRVPHAHAGQSASLQDESAKQHLEDICCTKVQYIPPLITGLSRPMDVSVMRSFKSNIQYLLMA
ncbi:hypothetical protein GQ600_19926 [Phytophthora cactorum]|nr:hypothetical protein GQ600_19926 [Phytophthora cactorum]